jgi:hypothetical protein
MENLALWYFVSKLVMCEPATSRKQFLNMLDAELFNKMTVGRIEHPQCMALLL